MNEQVKRNITRFPEDFMFQITLEETGNLKSQIATSSWGGTRKLPYVFTEQAFHCGASSKDAGKKLCAINKLEDTTMLHPVIDRLLLASDKTI